MATVEDLDSEISDIRARISALQSHRENLTSILLAQPNLSTKISEGRVNDEHQRARALKYIKAQQQRNTENLYRACAGVTAYKVRDPDPHAVDNGNILGVRIEVAIRNRYIETYHVLFNRPNPRHKLMLKIHKHTIPACIPLQALRNKWMPVTEKDGSVMVEQKLVNFGKALRKELVAWHLRTQAVENLRAEAGLEKTETAVHEVRKEHTIGTVLNAFVSEDEDDNEEDEIAPRRRPSGPIKITEIESDMGVREISITWSNGQIGVFSVMKDGQIDKAIVKAIGGERLVELNRKGLGRIEGLVQRLNE